jgi:hypothetical protein
VRVTLCVRAGVSECVCGGCGVGGEEGRREQGRVGGSEGGSDQARKRVRERGLRRKGGSEGEGAMGGRSEGKEGMGGRRSDGATERRSKGGRKERASERGNEGKERREGHSVPLMSLHASKDSEAAGSRVLLKKPPFHYTVP